AAQVGDLGAVGPVVCHTPGLEARDPTLDGAQAALERTELALAAAQLALHAAEPALLRPQPGHGLDDVPPALDHVPIAGHVLPAVHGEPQQLAPGALDLALELPDRAHGLVAVHGADGVGAALDERVLERVALPARAHGETEPRSREADLPGA